MRKEGRPGIVSESPKQRYDSQLLEGKGGGILIGKHILICLFSPTFFWFSILNFCCWLFFLVELICLHKQNFFWYPNINCKLNLEVCLLGWISKVDFRASQHNCCASGNSSQPAIDLPKSREQRLEALGSSTWGILILSVFLLPCFISENTAWIVMMFPGSSILIIAELSGWLARYGEIPSSHTADQGRN